MAKKKKKLMEKALDVASKIENDDDIVRALSVYCSLFGWTKKEEVMEKALDATFKIEDNSKKVEALSLLFLI